MNRKSFDTLKKQIEYLGPITKVAIGFEYNPDLNISRAEQHQPPSLVGEAFDFAMLAAKEKLPAYTGHEDPNELLELHYATTSKIATEILDVHSGISVVKTRSNSCYITLNELSHSLQGTKFFISCRDVKIGKGAVVAGATAMAYQEKCQTVGVDFEPKTITIEDVICINDTPVILLTTNKEVLLLFL